MDLLNKVTGSGGGNNTDQNKGGGGGFMDKVNNMAGGGQQGEANEDALDKGIDFVQEKVLGQGDQSNESALEQGQDKVIAGVIRDKYKDVTGSDFPIAKK